MRVVNVAELTAFERDVLDFEGRWWAYAKKCDAIVEHFKMKPSTYYLKRSEIIARPEALEYAPVTVRQLRRTNRAKATVVRVSATS